MLVRGILRDSVTPGACPMPERPVVFVTTHGDLLEAVFPGPVREQLESFAEARYNDRDRALTEDDLRERLADADACITSWGSPKLTPGVLDAAPRLKIVAHAAGSVRPVVTEEAFARGIIVTSSAGVIARYVGEMALLLSLAGLRQLPRYDAALRRERAWEPTDAPRPDTLREQRVGLIGFGATAREFASLLAPFKVTLLCSDPHVDSAALSEYGARAASLEEVLSTCRVISLHAASLPTTRHLLNAERLRLIGEGAVLVNTARGALIDTGALVEELKTGRFTAALDVFDPEEPLPPDHPLRSLPNVILTPHVAGPVPPRLWEMGRRSVENVRLAVQGQTPPGAITAEQFSWMA